MMMHDYMGMAHLLWMLFMALLVVVPFWRICRKAGFSGWLGLLVLLPLINLAFLYVLAFAEWPAQRKSEEQA